VAVHAFAASLDSAWSLLMTSLTSSPVKLATRKPIRLAPLAVTTSGTFPRPHTFDSFSVSSACSAFVEAGFR
jgi:hypothetical protein